MHRLDISGMGPAAARALRSVRAGGWRVGLLSALAVASVMASAVALADDASPLDAYAGRLIDIGSHVLHLDCRGQGSPVIVLESGIGGFSLEWRTVQTALARHRRVCTYDRAGYGWSEPGPAPRTARKNAEELHALLAMAGERPPYILAGHSYGGLIVRLFAERYAAEVAGIALIDAAAPEQFERLPAAVLPQALLAALAGGGRVLSLPQHAAGFPPALATLGQQLMMLPKARAAYLEEMRWFEASARQLMHQRDGALSAPLVVLSRARAEFRGIDDSGHAEAVWRDMQARMSRLSSDTDHWIAAGAGHQIHADRPDLVLLALTEVARAGARVPAVPEDLFDVQWVAAAPTTPRLVYSSWLSN